MEDLKEKLPIALVVIVIGLYFACGHYRINNFITEREGRSVSPKVSDYYISEMGYISELLTDNNYWEGKRRIQWAVKITKTDRVYDCAWNYGFSRFNKDDVVMLIHRNIDKEDCNCYLVGVHGSIKDKSASICAIDEEYMTFEEYGE